MQVWFDKTQKSLSQNGEEEKFAKQKEKRKKKRKKKEEEFAGLGPNLSHLKLKKKLAKN